MDELHENIFWITIVALTSCIQAADAQDSLAVIETLAVSDPKPFVIVEGTGKTSTNRAQGVVISSQGHVLSAGHIAWIDADKSFTDEFRISFRGTGKGLPSGAVHVHKVVFTDREDATFFEHYFPANLQRQGGSRFVAEGDLALFQIKAEGSFPKVEFFTKDKPTVTAGDILHLCHFSFPDKAGDPFFLINPVEVVGIAQTSSGIQYLAKGYYRVGSSGGAILKNGRLIGIQSSAYTVNAKDLGEIPLGLISFQLVWGGLFEGLLNPQHGNAAKAEQPPAGDVPEAAPEE
jgi:hypothetical protein